MSKAAYVIRQSQGADDSVSLELQREQVPALAAELADETVGVDLGNHTGFSIHTKDVDDERIDSHPDIEQLVEDLQAGEYDYLVAWDDTRLARDEFFAEFKRAVKLGGAEFAFVADVTEDELAFQVTRTVETAVKQKEIRKAKQAVQHRVKNGYWQGRPPYGLTLDGEKKHLAKGDDFESVVDVLDLRDAGGTYAEIERETGVSSSTAQRIVKRRELYEQFLDE